MESHSKAIQLLVKILKTTTQEIIPINFTIQTEIEQQKTQLEYQSKLSSLFREFEVTLNLVNTQLVQMQQVLDVISTEYLLSLIHI